MNISAPKSANNDPLPYKDIFNRNSNTNKNNNKNDNKISDIFSFEDFKIFIHDMCSSKLVGDDDPDNKLSSTVHLVRIWTSEITFGVFQRAVAFALMTVEKVSSWGLFPKFITKQQAIEDESEGVSLLDVEIEAQREAVIEETDIDGAEVAEKKKRPSGGLKKAARKVKKCFTKKKRTPYKPPWEVEKERNMAQFEVWLAEALEEEEEKKLKAAQGVKT